MATQARNIFTRAFVLLALLVAHASFAMEETNYFLIRYLPGENWNNDIAYEKQPGLKLHHQYLRQQQTHGPVVMAGPFSGALGGAFGGKSGGLVLVRTGSLEEAEAVARQDPGVKTKILRSEVVAWDIQMSSMRFDRREPMPPLDDPEQTFRVKRIDPESRINIEN